MILTLAISFTGLLVWWIREQRTAPDWFDKFTERLISVPGPSDGWLMVLLILVVFA